MGFDVHKNATDMEVCGSLRDKVFQAADCIMDRIATEDGVAGGAALIDIGDECECGVTHQIRVTVAIMSGEALCVWCDGTGVEGS